MERDFEPLDDLYDVQLLQESEPPTAAGPAEPPGGDSPPAGGRRPESPARRIPVVLALIACGVALERLSMIVFVTQHPSPAALAVAGAVFLAVPIVAGTIVIRAFQRERSRG